MSKPNPKVKPTWGIYSLLVMATFATLTTSTWSHAESVLEEIVVTAQKRQQSAQDVGIAITAFSGEQLKAFGVEQSFDIAAFSPGVHTSGSLAGQNTQFSIRGVTQNDFNDIIEAPNAVYLDDGYIAVAQAQTFAVFDIERVEILKGPQGTLFGRNATGGLVNYISRKPTFEGTEGYVDVSFADYDTPSDANRYTVEAAIGGPLSETVAGRVAVRFNRQEALLDNRFPLGGPAAGTLGSVGPGPDAGDDLGNDDTFAARGSLLIEPNDRLSISLGFNYADTQVSTGPYQSISTIGIVDENGELVNVIETPAGETRLSIQGDGDAGADAIDGDEFLPGAGLGIAERPVPGGDFFGFVDPDGDDFITSSDFAFDDQGETESVGASVRVEYEFGSGVQLTSITDFKQYEKALFIDVDAAPVNQLGNFAAVDADSFTQELRFSGENDRARWVTGLFFLHIDNESDNGLTAPENSILATIAAPLDIGVVAALETNSTSLFGQFEYDFSPNVTGIFGARVIQELKDYEVGIGIFPSLGNSSINEGQFIPNAVGAGSPFFFEDDTSDTLFTAKAQIDWRISEDLLFYAGINRGVKAGSFNAPLLGAFLGSGGNAALPYDEEVLLAYETGFKWSSPNGRARVNGTAFFYDYTDYQAFLFVGVGGVVINADATSIGAEFEFQYNPIDGLDILLSVSSFDAEVEDIPLRSGSPLPPRDVDPTYAPELQATGLVRYEWGALGGTLSVQGDVTYSDEFFYNLRNFDADQFDSYVLTNLQFGWRNPADTWEASLAVRNVTDERAGVQGFDLATLCGCNEVAYRPPRNVALSVRFNF